MLTKDFLSFLKESPTSYHCVKEVKKRLLKEGFSPLEEDKLWQMKKGGKYFVSRGGSIASFCIPTSDPKSLSILAAHTDSPALKVKPNPVTVHEGMNLLSVEVYGGPILHSWLNRDLALAGRCFLADGKEELIFLDEIPFIIPELAIHLNREVNKGIPINRQDHLMPLISMADKDSPLDIKALLQEQCGFKEILSYDLFLVPIQPPSLLGLKQEWIASYRIDNLTSVHAGVHAITSYQDSSTLPLAIFFDHEEIGSKSWEGAASTFTSDILTRIKAFLSLSDEEFLILKRNSLCHSLDMAHAVSPLHKSKHDVGHKPLLGQGLVVKENSDQRYATSAYTLSLVKRIAKKANVSIQTFAARSDIPCGSTIGPSITSSTGIAVVDLGCAQLSMHSTREIASVQDHLDSITYLKQALKPL
jgi:aspartyl aminopeptidase